MISFLFFCENRPKLHIPQELRIRSRGTERHSAFKLSKAQQVD